MREVERGRLRSSGHSSGWKPLCGLRAASTQCLPLSSHTEAPWRFLTGETFSSLEPEQASRTSVPGVFYSGWFEQSWLSHLVHGGGRREVDVFPRISQSHFFPIHVLHLEDISSAPTRPQLNAKQERFGRKKVFPFPRECCLAGETDKDIRNCDGVRGPEERQWPVHGK